MLDVFLFTRKYDRQRETTTEHEGAVGEIRRSHRAVPRILDMAEEQAGTHLGAIHLRHLHIPEDTLADVEGRGTSGAIHHELGGCHRLRPRGSVFHQSILLPELRDSI